MTTIVARAMQPIEPPTPRWVGEVVAASNEMVEAFREPLTPSEEERALDALYDRIDDAMIAGDFSTVDREIAAVDVENTSLTMLLGWLTITYPVKDKLPSRARLATRVFVRAEQEEGTAAALELVRGLVDVEPDPVMEIPLPVRGDGS